MKPGNRAVQLTSAVLIGMAALSACRKEVPSPPLPVPEKDPKPTVQATAYAAHAVPGRAALRLVA